ncbi:MAG TPA: alpha/beta hydrolase [Vicinamibacterales bacterium]|nr:alpha/beta hydrolase [Vicinamibacterales bacterium]
MLIAVGLLLTLAAIGVFYQAVSVRREAGRFPPPGRLVDIGGRRLHLLCIGEGSPVVIFESSGFGNALSSSKAREEIGARTRVCSYDRMGTGWSDPGPDIIPAGALADDLERLLDRAAVPPPYILVASSIGGLTSELFARRHADRVAGLVFLDAATSGLLDRLLPDLTWTRTQAACLATLAARVGLLRLMDPFDLRRNGTEYEARAVALMYRVEPMATICGIVRGAPTTAEEFRAAPPLAPDVTLTVLSAESNKGLLPAGWAGGERIITKEERYAIHEAMSRRSSRGQWRIVPGSSHLIGSSQPQAVASAVIEMIEQIRGRAARPAGSS